MANYCTNCGVQNEDGVKFCTSCGAALKQQEAPRQQASYQNSAAARPDMGYNIPEDDREKVMGLGAWLVTFLLMIIPIVNIILLIKWAVSGGTNKNKQNMARAALIVMVVCILLCVVIGNIITPLITEFVYNTVGNQIGVSQEDLEGLSETLQQFQDMGSGLDLEQLQMLQQLTPEQLEELGATQE